jgi:hypothetical protein
MVSVVYAECRYAECHGALYHIVKGRGAKQQIPTGGGGGEQHPFLCPPFSVCNFSV